MPKGFLMEGPIETTILDHPLCGIRYISNGPIEYIGNIIKVVDGIATVDEPVLIGRDKTNPALFNLVPFNKANPIVQKRIEVPLCSITFLCSPPDSFLRNYNAAKARLINTQGTTSTTPN